MGEVFRTLGLRSFGGPVAHLGYFREEYVARRGWLDEEQFGELVALTNLLPGPSSSQLGIAIGTQRAGKLGGLAAWVGFTLPSALALTAVALWARNVDLARAGWVHGLELAAAAVYRAGALVFGGGHVVLPLLNDAVVGPGWVSQQAFLAGYGVAQAVPGPLFTFSAYLGAIEQPSPNGVSGAAIALCAIFLPSFLLLAAVLPVWSRVRERARVQAAVAGIGAAVVGLLAAALWNPILSTSVHGVGDVAFAGVLFLLLRPLPAWAVVGIAAAAGALVF